jgi:aconitate hydratase
MSEIGQLFTTAEIAAYRALPRTLRILAENTLRNGYHDDTLAILGRKAAPLRLRPTRLVMQDLLAVPLLADLASLRDELAKRNVDPTCVHPHLPTDLVVDHSMTVEHYGSPQARRLNEEREISINRERFTFLRWCGQAFSNLRMIPPGNGIVHQINLEQLATCAVAESTGDAEHFYPEFVIGNDSHTPMINGLGVLGWGVGGLEAEIVLLGRPLEIITPKVVGVRLAGRLRGTATATDLALYLTELLRKADVVDQFVEFFGPGLADLSVADRATASNMAPEYGATCAYFPIDQMSLDYLDIYGRSRTLIEQVERMARGLELWNDGNESMAFDRVIELDLSTLRSSVAGPARPHDRVLLEKVPAAFTNACSQKRRVEVPALNRSCGDGDIVVAAITSCTTTANPRAMLQAGLLARNAVRRGLKVPQGIKTSFAPGSLDVANYLTKFGLQNDLDALGFNVVGFACTTCNGMSGPIHPAVAAAVDGNNLHCAAVLSGNRNFPGRIHPQAQANFIMSPALVVAYAIAGTILKDLTSEPIGMDSDGQPALLSDIWPDEKEVDALVARAAQGSTEKRKIVASEESRNAWNALPMTIGPLYAWGHNSTYVRPSPYFAESTRTGKNGIELRGLRPIAMFGDAINTDHIAPVGFIKTDSAAGQFLLAQGVAPKDFNSYGTRRANPEIVARSFFANHTLQNRMTESTSGSVTRLLPSGNVVPIFDAVEAYGKEGVGVIVIAGRNYGSGSSRDTAAKASYLAGVKAVIARSFERIHRSNLVNMGIVPLEFTQGQSIDSLGLLDAVSFDIAALPSEFSPHMTAVVTASLRGGAKMKFETTARISTASELKTILAGGILTEMVSELATRPQ